MERWNGFRTDAKLAVSVTSPVRQTVKGVVYQGVDHARLALPLDTDWPTEFSKEQARDP